MRSKNKQILVVGDRVLIKPDKGEKKSKAGLYLPPSVVEKQEILSGVIVEVGPGIPLGNPDDNIDEPWSNNDNSSIKYIPTQADIGDIALFLNKASIEIKIENDDYLIVPQSAILILIRDDINSLAD
ncbi:MAG: chaperonin [Candidatus Marinimicrobia bacterium]|nr:chaperonin [Candidatus Neomarinimicrobiota bacterium]MBO01265.1 chaperonin [Candidatus Neomarinimicrobiota bacterium]MEC7854435.1 co-chaperone GroES family protein [Candidatus Neomarinimicrobiota bacterium]MEC7980776.1 co-chaperone GroES family protein [Candidatus Neomarinimicrobiota bacterium]|tara:strand:- start:2327 stop:2707 length:381 start_codon:yes stop_codon:yes gene_type:complete